MTKYINASETRRNAYHTDKDCHKAPERLREVSDAEIEYHDYPECKICAGENVTKDNGTNWRKKNRALIGLCED